MVESLPGIPGMQGKHFFLVILIAKLQFFLKFKKYYFTAATPGSTLPSMASRSAPPPVET